MNETSVECMVKRKNSGPLTALKILLIVIAVIAFLLGTIGGILFLIVGLLTVIQFRAEKKLVNYT